MVGNFSTLCVKPLILPFLPGLLKSLTLTYLGLQGCTTMPGTNCVFSVCFNLRASQMVFLIY
jgi:hypothetical protein